MWFDATNLAIAIFVDDKKLADKIVQSAGERLNAQMDDKGYFPLELERTTSLHYTAFILDAFTVIAQLSEKTNTNFWTLQTRSKKSLEKGYETILPFFADNKKWTSSQIKPFTMRNAFQILWRADTKYNCTSCKSIIKNNSANFDKLLLHLL